MPKKLGVWKRAKVKIREFGKEFLWIITWESVKFGLRLENEDSKNHIFTINESFGGKDRLMTICNFIGYIYFHVTMGICLWNIRVET